MYPKKAEIFLKIKNKREGVVPLDIKVNNKKRRKNKNKQEIKKEKKL